IGASLDRLRHPELEVAGLVPAKGEAGQVIALDPEVDVEIGGQARTVLERCRQEGQLDARGLRNPGSQLLAGEGRVTHPVPLPAHRPAGTFTNGTLGGAGHAVAPSKGQESLAPPSYERAAEPCKQPGSKPGSATAPRWGQHAQRVLTKDATPVLRGQELGMVPEIRQRLAVRTVAADVR